MSYQPCQKNKQAPPNRNSSNVAANELRKAIRRQVALSPLQQQQIFENATETENAIKTQRYAQAVLMKFIGYTEEQVHSNLVKQLVKDILTWTRKRDSGREICDLDLLLEYIRQLFPGSRLKWFKTRKAYVHCRNTHYGIYSGKVGRNSQSCSPELR
ncbi:MAG: hypothetical protein EZS28_019826 [Streblomastix strix]|uniref:Uncharacterized protein n=1 Tax=Streblomastix strix TaxID=222440 RepID=A0A5J4VPS4_9EUKA|nr:MAG: hypothetical protein EZS28_019826 [Streblomastix strix]